MKFKAKLLILFSFFLIATGIVYILGLESEYSDNNEVDSNDFVNEDDSSGENNGLPGDQKLRENTDGMPAIHEGRFELPINGAAGYSSISMRLLNSSNSNAETIEQLKPGTPFKILYEEGEWWKIETLNSSGWIEHKYAFINLPDVMPSIIYDNTNSYSSLFKSSYQDIPELTGEALYEAVDYNERLEEEIFIMPVLYSTAEKISVAQRLALTNGEALKLYETYRPFDIQVLVGESLTALSEEDEDIRENLNSGPWTLS